MNPKISIITVSYNQGQYIEENIKSVLDQKYPNFEHIIIDGGSTDDTVGILEKYSHLNWVSEPDSGQSNGLNKGFRKATGEIIGWINSDDKLTINSLNIVGNYFKNNPGCIGIVGDLLLIDRYSQTVSTNISKEYSHEYLLNKAKGITQPSIFFKRSVLKQIGYLDESLHYAMDRDFFIRVTKLGKLHYIPETLASFRVQPESKTSEGSYKFARELIRIRRKYNGSMFGAGNISDLYLIVTQPLRAISWLRNLVRAIKRVPPI